MRFKYKKLMFAASLGVMLLGMVLFSTGNSFGSNQKVKDEKKTVTEQTNNVTGTAVKSGTGTAISNGVLMKNITPEINTLIADYFNARLAVDENKIAELVDDINYAGISKLPVIVKDIESINNIECYTLDGPEENSHMVYAYSEVKFKGVDTLASSLDGFYVRKDETGKFKIILSPLSDEVQKIIDADSERDDVTSLISDVNTKLANEITADKKLADMLNKIKEQGKVKSKE